ncbi:Small RNA 2'-O-methyltransferase, partial [Dissophora globulifera]
MSSPGIENRIRSGTPTPAETGKELQEQPEQQDSYVSELGLKEVEQEEDEEEEIGEEARFFPPLWQQRRRLAQSIIEDHHATSVIDFGCGEGALLSFLVWETLGEFPITRIAGVDMDASRLEIAAETSQPQHFELGPNLRVHELSIEIYHGSVADPDLRMVGFDALACLEV